MVTVINVKASACLYIISALGWLNDSSIEAEGSSIKLVLWLSAARSDITFHIDFVPQPSDIMELWST